MTRIHQQQLPASGDPVQETLDRIVGQAALRWRGKLYVGGTEVVGEPRIEEAVTRKEEYHLIIDGRLLETGVDRQDPLSRGGSVENRIDEDMRESSSALAMLTEEMCEVPSVLGRE